MSEAVLTYVVLGLIGTFWAPLFFAPLIGNSTSASVKHAKAEGCYRIVEIEGKQYHGIKKQKLLWPRQWAIPAQC